MSLNKKVATEKRIEFLKRKCKELEVFCEEFHANSFRLSRLGKIIDYYPKSNKCFWHSNHEWGEVANLNEFLSFEFK